MYRTLRRAARRIKRRLQAPRDSDFMHLLRGVVHVGANTGQERALYDSYRLPVLWIEPIPEVYAELRANLASYPEQRALCALIADREGVAVDFHVANNAGASSSMLELGQHRELWPEVSYSRTLKLVTTTLDALLRDGQIAPAGTYNALIMDTQGSELLVLQGAETLLRQIDVVKTEAADFESYVGCCRLDQIDAFMRAHGFAEFSRRRFAGREGVGAYYDVAYRRTVA